MMPSRAGDHAVLIWQQRRLRSEFHQGVVGFGGADDGDLGAAEGFQIGHGSSTSLMLFTRPWIFVIRRAFFR
jgi:hypothetical protein